MNNSEILGEEAAVRQIVEDDFSATNGVFEDDSVITLSGRALSSKNNLEAIRLPNLINFPGYQKTNNNRVLNYLDLGKIQNGIDTDFTTDYFLDTILLRNTTGVVPLSRTSYFDGAFYYYRGPFGHIYVPSALVSQYQQATNWASLYANNNDLFRAIEDYTLDRTTTGEFDLTRIDTIPEPDYSFEDYTFDGASYKDSGIQLYDGTLDGFTIIIDVDIDRQSGTRELFICHDFSSNKGVRLTVGNNSYWLYCNSGMVNDNFATEGFGRYRIVCVGTPYWMNLMAFNANGKITGDGNYIAFKRGSTSTGYSFSRTLVFGAKEDDNGNYSEFSKEHFNSCKVYKKALSYRQIKTIIGI